MDRARLEQHLTEAYGSECTIRTDARGLVVGTNHRLPSDCGITVGTRLTSLECARLLAHDIDTAWSQVLTLWPAADEYPELAQQVLAHLTFAVGAKLDTATALVALVDHQDWRGAAMALEQTQWAHGQWDQAARLVAWLRALAPEGR